MKHYVEDNYNGFTFNKKDHYTLSKKIEVLRKRWVYNFGSSAEKGAKYLTDIAERHRRERDI